MQHKYSSLEGFLILNKPRDVTSYSVVARLKWMIRDRVRIGHAGTLDMFASGLLIVGIGRAATRALDQCMKLDKRYRATGKLGQLTDSLDYQGALLINEEPPAITQEQLQKSIASFGATYEQTPPIFSALKYEGYSLSDLVRKGMKTEEEMHQIVHAKKRSIQIHDLALINVTNPFFTIDAYVSHGTYIRSLVNDIAQKMGTHATTYELSRTYIGPLGLSDAIFVEDIMWRGDIEKNLIPVEVMLARIDTSKR